MANKTFPAVTPELHDETYTDTESTSRDLESVCLTDDQKGKLILVKNLLQTKLDTCTKTINHAHAEISVQPEIDGLTNLKTDDCSHFMEVPCTSRSSQSSLSSCSAMCTQAFDTGLVAGSVNDSVHFSLATKNQTTFRMSRSPQDEMGASCGLESGPAEPQSPATNPVFKMQSTTNSLSPTFCTPKQTLSGSCQKKPLQVPRWEGSKRHFYRNESLSQDDLSSDGGSLSSASLTSIDSISSAASTGSTNLENRRIDFVLLHSDDDLEIAHTCSEHLIAESGVHDLTVLTLCEMGIGKTEMSVLDTLYDRCNYILPLVTKNLTSDRHKLFLNEILLTCGLKDKTGEKAYRVVPVQMDSTPKDRIPELMILGGLEYHRFITTESKELKNYYRNKIRNLVQQGREANR